MFKDNNNIMLNVDFCKNAMPAGEIGIVQDKSYCINNSCKLFLMIVDNVYCNANENDFKVKYERVNNTIYITAIFDGKVATRCVCPVIINVTIPNLEKGNYTIIYVFDNRYSGKREIVDKILVRL